MGAFDRAPVLRDQELADEAFQPDQMTDFQTGLIRGAGSMGYGLQAAMGQLVQPISPMIGNAVIDDAAASEHYNVDAFAPSIASSRDIRTLEDAGKYISGHAAAMVPMLPLGYGAGMGTRLAGGSAAQAMAAGGAAFAPQMMGMEAMNLQADPNAKDLSPMQKLAYSAGVGGASALAMGAIPGMMGGSVARPAQHSLAQALIQRPVQNVVGGAAGMAGGDFLSQKSQLMYNPEAQFDPERFREAGIAGAAGMLPMAGAHAVPEALGGTAMHGVDAAKGLVDGMGAGVNAVGRHIYSRFPEPIKKAVDAMVEAGKNIDEIYAFLEDHGVQLVEQTKSTINNVVDNVSNEVNLASAEARATGQPPNVFDTVARSASHVADGVEEFVQRTTASAKVFADELIQKGAPEPIKDWFKAIEKNSNDPDAYAGTVAEFLGDKNKLGKWVKDGTDQLDKAGSRELHGMRGRALQQNADGMLEYMKLRGLDKNPDNAPMFEAFEKAKRGETLEDGDFNAIFTLAQFAKTFKAMAPIEKEMGGLFNRVKAAQDADGLTDGSALSRGKTGDPFKTLMRGKDIADDFWRYGIQTPDEIAPVANLITAGRIRQDGIKNTLRNAFDKAGLAHITEDNGLFKALEKRLKIQKDVSMDNIPDSGVKIPDELRRSIKNALSSNVVANMSPEHGQAFSQLFTHTVEVALGQGGNITRQKEAQSLLARMADSARAAERKAAEKEGAVIDPEHSIGRAFDDAFRAIEEHYGNDTIAIKALAPMAYGTTGRAGILQRARERFEIPKGTKGFPEKDTLERMRIELRDAQNRDTNERSYRVGQQGDEYTADAIRDPGTQGELVERGTRREFPDTDALYARWQGRGLLPTLKRKPTEPAEIYERRVARDKKDLYALIQRYGRLDPVPNSPEGSSSIARPIAEYERRLTNHPDDVDTGDYEYQQGTFEGMERLDPKRLSERSDGKEKAIGSQESAFGVQGEVESAPVEFTTHGREVFDTAENRGNRIGAPFDTHPKRVFDHIEEGDKRVRTMYAEKNADLRQASVVDWAAEMAAAHGKDDNHWLQIAYDATMGQTKRDIARLQRMEGGTKPVAAELKALKERLELGEKLSASPYSFFDRQELTKNLKYYIVEPKPQGAGHLSTRQLIRDHTARGYTEAAWIERLQAQDNGKFADPETYKKGFLKVVLEDGRTIDVDLPGLVRKRVHSEQPVENSTAGDKSSLINKSEMREQLARDEQMDGRGHETRRVVPTRQMEQAFKDTITSILTQTPGVDAKATMLNIVKSLKTRDSQTQFLNKAGMKFLENGGKIDGLTREHVLAHTGKLSLELAPDRVIYRDNEGGRALTYGQHRALTAIDDRVPTWTNVGKNGVRLNGNIDTTLLAPEVLDRTSRFDTPDVESSKTNKAATKGIAYGVAEIKSEDGVVNRASINLRELLRGLVERMDPETDMTKLPTNLLAKLLDQGIKDLEGLGYKGIREALLGSDKYDELTLMTRKYGTDGESTVLLKKVLNYLKDPKKFKDVPFDRETAQLMALADATRENDAALIERIMPGTSQLNPDSIVIKDGFQKVQTLGRRQVDNDKGNFSPNDIVTPKRPLTKGELSEINEKLAAWNERFMELKKDPEKPLTKDEAAARAEERMELGKKIIAANSKLRADAELKKHGPGQRKSEQNENHPEDTEDIRMETVREMLKDEDGVISAFDAAERDLFSRYVEAGDKLRRDSRVELRTDDEILADGDKPLGEAERAWVDRPSLPERFRSGQSTRSEEAAHWIRVQALRGKDGEGRVGETGSFKPDTLQAEGGIDAFRANRDATRAARARVASDSVANMASEGLPREFERLSQEVQLTIAKKLAEVGRDPEAIAAYEKMRDERIGAGNEPGEYAYAPGTRRASLTEPIIAENLGAAARKSQLAELQSLQKMGSTIESTTTTPSVRGTTDPAKLFAERVAAEKAKREALATEGTQRNAAFHEPITGDKPTPADLLDRAKLDYRSKFNSPIINGKDNSPPPLSLGKDPGAVYKATLPIPDSQLRGLKRIGLKGPEKAAAVKEEVERIMAEDPTTEKGTAEVLAEREPTPDEVFGNTQGWGKVPVLGQKGLDKTFNAMTEAQKGVMVEFYRENPPEKNSIGEYMLEREVGPEELDAIMNPRTKGESFADWIELFGEDSSGPRHKDDLIYSKSKIDLDPSFTRGKARLEKMAKVFQRDLDRMVGVDVAKIDNSVPATDDAGNFVAGKTFKATDGIWRVAISSLHTTLSGGKRTTAHEGWHVVEGMVAELGPSGKRVLDVIHRFVDSDMAKEWLAKEFSHDKDALSQMTDQRERAAYLYQRFVNGEAFPVTPQVRGIWNTIKNFVKELLGFTSDAAQTKNFLKAVKDGKFGINNKNGPEVERLLGANGKGDKAWRAVRDVYEPLAEGVGKMFQHTSTRLRELKNADADFIHDLYAGPSGKAGMLASRQMMFNHFANKLGLMLEGIPEDKYGEVRNTKEFQELMASVEPYMAEAGMADKDILNFAKSVDSYNHNLILENREGFIKDVEDFGGIRGMKADAARRIANEILDKGFYYDPGKPLFEGNPHIANKWRSTDLIERAVRVFHTATDLAERRRYFGEGNKTLNDALARIEKTGTPEAKEMVKDFVDSMEGRYGGKLSPAMRQLTGAALTLNNILLLPKAVFAQALEAAQIANRSGNAAAGFSAAFRAITNLPRSFDFVDSLGKGARDKWEQISMSLGTAAHRMVRNDMSRLYNGTPVTGRIGWLNDKFFQYNGMEQTNRSMHIEGTKQAILSIQEHVANVKAGRGAKDTEGGLRSVRMLRELGLDASEVAWDANGEPANYKTKMAVAQWVNEAVAHPDAGSNPLWMNDERFAIIAHMKRFSFSFSKYVLDHSIHEWGHGNYFAMAALPMALSFMAASEAIKEAITPGPGRTAGMDFMEYLAHLSNRAGLAGRGTMATDAIAAANFGGSPLESLAGPTLETGSKMARALGSTKINPAAEPAF